MKYAKVNYTDINSSKIILGSDGFGTEVTQSDSFKMMDYFLDAGGNNIDTALFYADWFGGEKSLSEKTIGKWLYERNNRHSVIISTKGGHPRLETMDISRLSRDELLSDVESSLKNLKTDYIDIYWLHRDDEKKSVDEIMETLSEIVKSGKARYIAAANWKYDRIKEANTYAEKHGLSKFIGCQIRHSIAKVNDDVLDETICTMTDSEYKKYKADDLNVFAFSSQAKGFFALMDKGGCDAVPDSVKQEFLNDYNVNLFNRLKEFSKKKSVSVPALVIASLVYDDNINVFAQIGPRTMEQLDDSLSCMNVDMTNEERKILLGLN